MFTNLIVLFLKKILNKYKDVNILNEKKVNIIINNNCIKDISDRFMDTDCKSIIEELTNVYYYYSNNFK